jgi:hypothetical protein
MHDFVFGPPALLERKIEALKGDLYPRDGRIDDT